MTNLRYIHMRNWCAVHITVITLRKTLAFWTSFLNLLSYFHLTINAVSFIGAYEASLPEMAG